MRRLILICTPVLALLTASLALSAEKKPVAGREDTKTYPQFNAASFIKEYDRNKDGSISQKECPRCYHHNFKKIDTNNDGKLSQKELKKGYTHLHARRRPSDMVFILVEMSDGDEYSVREVQRMYQVMRKLDRNNDGKLSKDEFKKGREAIIKKRVDGIVDELDSNKDGQISKEEARGQVRVHFDMLDTNNDDSVTHQELSEAASAKSAKGTSKAQK